MGYTQQDIINILGRACLEAKPMIGLKREMVILLICGYGKVLKSIIDNTILNPEMQKLAKSAFMMASVLHKDRGRALGEFTDEELFLFMLSRKDLDFTVHTFNDETKTRQYKFSATEFESTSCAEFSGDGNLQFYKV